MSKTADGGSISPNERPNAVGSSFMQSIRGKLFLLLIVVLLPIITAQLLIYRDRLNSKRDSEIRMNLEVARATAASFDDFIQHIILQEQGIAFALSSFETFDSIETKDFIEGIGSHYPEFEHFLVINSAGRVEASTNPDLVGIDVSDRPYFRRIVEGEDWAVSELMRSKADGKEIFVIGSPIHDRSGAFMGVIAVSLEDRRLRKMMSFPRFGGDLTILDKNGRAVYRSPEIEWEWDQRYFKKYNHRVTEALSGKEVFDVSEETIDGKRRIYAMAPISSIGWVSRASIPEADALSLSYRRIYQNAGLFFLVVVVALLASMHFSRRISDPIRKLRSHAQSLQRGEWSHPVDVDGPIEVEEFAATFNSMVEEIHLREEKLQKAKDELDLLVQERTAELLVANTALKNYTRQLELKHRELAEFSFLAAHDLQEPLRKIQVFSDLIRTEYGSLLDEGGRQYLDRVTSSARRSRRLIRGIQDYSLLANRSKPFKEIDLNEVIETIVIPLKDKVEETGARIEHNGLPVLQGEESQLHLLFENLLRNALEYRGKEPPVVRITSKEIGDPNAKGEEVLFHRICVEDNGIGFDENNTDQIFKIFRRLHDHDEHEGIGMGLAICRKIVELHGGKITVRSTPGEGSTFMIDLPEKQETLNEI